MNPADRWPPWFALLGFVLAFTAAFLLAVIVSSVAAVITGTDDPDAPGVIIAATVLQDGAFVLAAVWLARQAGPADAAAFGLRPVPFRVALGWTVGVGASFYALLAGYSAVVQADGEQSVLDNLGADEGLGLLVVAGLLVVVLAPFAEEILFRGFMYRCVRNRFGPAAASLIIGAVFGSIHYTGPDTLAFIPPLIALGIAFCVLYERTGSLYPAIALHAVNNALTFALTADQDGAPVVAAVGLGLVLAVCVAATRRGRATDTATPSR